MKKIPLTALLLLSLTITISCKKDIKGSVKKVETISNLSETNTATMQDSVTNDLITIDTIIGKVTEEKLVLKTFQETKNKITEKTTENEIAIAKKTEEIIIQEVEEIVEPVKEKIEIIVEETQKEIIKKITEPIKEEIKEESKQLTKSEKIALGKTLFTTGICKNCHHQTKKMIGPTLVTIGSIYKKKNGSIATLLKGNGKPIVDPKRFNMMKPNIDDVTRHMSIQDLEALEAYILSFAK